MKYKIKKGTKRKVKILIKELGYPYEWVISEDTGSLFINVKVARADRAALRALLNELQEKQDEAN